MPCVICFAVLVLTAGTVTGGVLDQLAARLAAAGFEDVERAVDTGSVTSFEFTAKVGVTRSGARRKTVRVPVRVTVYKQHGRVRIQVLDHVLDAAGTRALEKRVAGVIGADIVGHEDAHRAGPEHTAAPGVAPQSTTAPRAEIYVRRR